MNASLSIQTAAPEVSEAATDGKERMRRFAKHCNNFKGSDLKRSLFQLTTTAGAYFALCAIMISSFMQEQYAVTYLLMLPAAGLLVRLFIIQHDCGHGSYFQKRSTNEMVGRLISVLTITPYDFWRQAHAMHHATSGNLNRRGIGSLDTLTVKEYQALPDKERKIYTVYRNAFTQLIVVPILYIFFIQRFPPSQSLPFLKEYTAMPLSKSWRSIVGLDVALLVFFSAMIYALGWKPVLLVYIPIIMITSWAGGWLFFVQHQFEETYWNPDKEWDFHEASILGSSYYILPPVLQWFTGNIGIHHIHHVCSMIPNYKLQACVDASEELKSINRLSLWESFRCLRWALWDDAQRKMVGFADLKAKAA